MEQLVRELKLYLHTKYSKDVIKQVGLEEDEDIARLMIDNRERPNFKPELIIDEYIQEQIIAGIMEMEEEECLSL